MEAPRELLRVVERGGRGEVCEAVRLRRSMRGVEGRAAAGPGQLARVEQPVETGRRVLGAMSQARVAGGVVAPWDKCVGPTDQPGAGVY